MKKFLILIGILALASCKPEVYLGPLDTPIGNWKAQASRYYFNGENVYENGLCTYSAISFYKDSLCCIEGIKGTFQWTLDSDSLVVDTVIWKVMEMSGAQMTLDYLGTVERPVEDTDDGESDGQTPQEPVIYNGKTIESDGKRYWYVNDEGKQVGCRPVSVTAEDGSTSIACWWDTRSDTYKPF